MRPRLLCVVTIAVAIAASPALASAFSSSSGEGYSTVTVSPNGQLVAFTVFRGDCGRLMLINIDGTNERQLTPRGLCVSEQTTPEFSPNSTKILFGVAPQSKYGQALLTLSLDTVTVSSGKVTRVVKTPWDSSDRSAVWSPDGSRIAYVHYDHYASKCDGCIFVQRIGQAKPQHILVAMQGDEPGGTIDTLAWSPNGAWIAFTTNNSALWRIRPNGSGKKQLSQGHLVIQDDLSWSPDSTTIAYTGGGNNAFNIRTVNVAGTVHKVIISAGDDTVEPVFSPDGKQIAYEHAGLDGWYGDYVIFVANSDGSDPHPVSQTAHEDAISPCWAPNDVILYATVLDGIFSVPAAGGSITHFAP